MYIGHAYKHKFQTMGKGFNIGMTVLVGDTISKRFSGQLSTFSVSTPRPAFGSIFSNIQPIISLTCDNIIIIVLFSLFYTELLKFYPVVLIYSRLPIPQVCENWDKPTIHYQNT